MSEDRTGEAAGRALRSTGMRDLGPAEMERFRRVEGRFLEVTGAAGYLEIRTPTLEPLHLFASSGSLSPQQLDGVYSFLDWDGWSGERVVLRPDTTVPAARWFEEHAQPGEAARLCYVQPVYRFSAADGERELWQCGVELFGMAAPDAEIELLRLGHAFLDALGLGDIEVELSHAGLVRAALAAAGLTPQEQIETYDRLLAGEAGAVERLLTEHPQGSSSLRLLFGVDGEAAGYLANLRATLVNAVPESAAAVAELEAVAAALGTAGIQYRVRPGAARSFEYYTGVTFVLRAAGQACLNGGRYDGLCEALGGRPAPAAGFGGDLLRLARLAGETGA